MKEETWRSRPYDIEGYVGRIVLFSDGSRKTILEHREIMEGYLGRRLSTNEIVHHIDGNKKNNALANLKLVNRVSHAKEHRRSPEIISVVCAFCGESFEKYARRLRDEEKRRSSGPYCSASCASKGTASKRRPSIKHGKRSGYKRGCRCDACKTSHNDYMRRLRSRRKDDRD